MPGMPVADLNGWRFVDGQDFNTDAPLGQVATVYGATLAGYDGLTDTSGNGLYRPARVLSVADSVLRFWLHTEAGQALVAAPVPFGYAGRTYMRWAVRLRVDPAPGYKIAFLLWPSNDDWANGEIDWPENNQLSDKPRPATKKLGDYTSTFKPSPLVYAATDLTTWCTAVTEWRPGSLKFFLDDVLVAEVTDAQYIPTTGMRITLQAETVIGGGAPPSTSNGYVHVDWVARWDYDPTATAPTTTSAWSGPVEATTPAGSASAWSGTAQATTPAAVTSGWSSAVQATTPGTSRGGSTTLPKFSLTATAAGKRVARGSRTASLALTASAEGFSTPEPASLVVIGSVRGWRYMAQRITGDGKPGPWLSTELPLTGVTITDVLSGPTQISGTIDPVYRGLLGPDGRPLLEEWGTVIYAEADGEIRGAGIYRTGAFDGPKWQLTCAGFASYPHGMGYEAEASFVQTDPLDIVRHIWAHLQGGLDSHLGLVVDNSTTTSVRVGTEPTADDTSSEGPFELNPWSTDDLGRVIDDLARSTPFDYHERHFWNGRRDQVLHQLEFGYPGFGQRRPELRFVLGENIQTVPAATRDGERYASHVRFLGAGEGRDMIRAEASMRTGRLRRMYTLDDKSVTGANRAQRFARRELTARQLLPEISQVVCRDSPQTPFGSWAVGDEIRVQGELDWMPINLWFRVVSITVAPENPELIGMTLMRSDLT